MRHRFHSICPYFAMFPETFVKKQLAETHHDGVVFDPFCGRGTTIFESLLLGRSAAGCDIHPVAACISGAKSNPPKMYDILARLDALEESFDASVGLQYPVDLEAFFSACFEQHTYKQVLHLRAQLAWQVNRTDRFIAALCLGALHGESHRSPNYFSNRMPRTISTKPAYSVRWWAKNGYFPPPRNVFAILRYATAYRFRTPPPERVGRVALSDARQASKRFPELKGQVTDVITSPPYLDTTNYREDQWLRLWFLGETASSKQQPDDGRHCNVDCYWTFLQEAWNGLRPLLASEVRMVVRIGSRKLKKEELSKRLIETLSEGTGMLVQLFDGGFTSPIERSQANSFRGSKASPIEEHDFCFILS
ncbi:MAG: DNA methyltransferase [Aestuariivita sp.]|nr:DNA methyltransferase [Aestuariivita sp.]